MSRLLPTNTISQLRPLPRPLPPLTLSWILRLIRKIQTGSLFEPVSWLNRWHDFFCAKNIPGFCRQLFVPLFRFNEFLCSFMKPCFRILNPLLLHPPRCTPGIEPQSAKFLHTVCQRFCQPSEPCSDPCFLLFNGQWRGGWGGGQM
jgi:hypothetical protein